MLLAETSTWQSSRALSRSSHLKDPLPFKKTTYKKMRFEISKSNFKSANSHTMFNLRISNCKLNGMEKGSQKMD